jgi:hypothetical protein
MAYNEHLAERIGLALQRAGAAYEAKKMMGGLCFMVDGKMCCGIHIDKTSGQDLLMARVGEEAYDSAMEKEGCHPMDFTGRPMKGFVFVSPIGFDADDDLEEWLTMCLAYNPKAKASKKRK